MLLKKLQKRSEPTRFKLTRDTCKGVIQPSAPLSPPHTNTHKLSSYPQMYEHLCSLGNGWLSVSVGKKGPKDHRETHRNQPQSLIAEQRTQNTFVLNVFIL